MRATLSCLWVWHCFPDRFDTFALYVFLFILGYNPVLWSLGKFLISGASSDRPLWRGLLTPPFVANIVAIIAALTGATALLPRPALEAVSLIGSAAVPVATLVLGAVLGSVTIRFRSILADAVRTMGVKLLVLPALTRRFARSPLRSRRRQPAARGIPRDRGRFGAAGGGGADGSDLWWRRTAHRQHHGVFVRRLHPHPARLDRDLEFDRGLKVGFAGDVQLDRTAAWQAGRLPHNSCYQPSSWGAAIPAAGLRGVHKNPGRNRPGD